MPPSSSGLGHHPFKVAARVRIPLGVREIKQGRTSQFGPVVKLEFTPACQAGGRGFESRRDRSGESPIGVSCSHEWPANTVE